MSPCLLAACCCRRPPRRQFVRLSVSTAGTQANGPSVRPAISGDGRFVVFASAADNLVAGDTNGCRDIFLRDRDTDADGIFDEAGAVATTRISVGPGGVQANGASYRPGDHAGCALRLLHLEGDQSRGAPVIGEVLPGLPPRSHDGRPSSSSASTTSAWLATRIRARPAISDAGDVSRLLVRGRKPGRRSPDEHERHLPARGRRRAHDAPVAARSGLRCQRHRAVDFGGWQPRPVSERPRVAQPVAFAASLSIGRPAWRGASWKWPTPPSRGSTLRPRRPGPVTRYAGPRPGGSRRRCTRSGRPPRRPTRPLAVVAQPAASRPASGMVVHDFDTRRGGGPGLHDDTGAAFDRQDRLLAVATTDRTGRRRQQRRQRRLRDDLPDDLRRRQRRDRRSAGRRFFSRGLTRPPIPTATAQTNAQEYAAGTHPNGLLRAFPGRRRDRLVLPHRHRASPTRPTTPRQCC